MLLNLFEISGTAKSGKIMIALSSAKSAAEKVRDTLQKHLDKDCRSTLVLCEFKKKKKAYFFYFITDDTSILQEVGPMTTIDHHIKKVREEYASSSKWKSAKLGDDMDNFHKLNRAREELALLEVSIVYLSEDLLVNDLYHSVKVTISLKISQKYKKN